MILVTGGAGFIGANFVLDWLASSDEAVLNLDALTYAGNLRQPELAAGRRAARVRSRRHHRPRAARPPVRRAPPARRGPLRRREPRRPQHPRAGRVHPHQRRRHVHAARSRPRALEQAARRREGGVPLPPRVDRRGVRIARPRRGALHRAAPLRAEQPVLGEQGGERPPRARLAPHLRPAGAHHQLQQQLRAATTSPRS